VELDLHTGLGVRSSRPFDIGGTQSISACENGLN
jgi:hypothetical protein